MQDSLNFKDPLIVNDAQACLSRGLTDDDKQWPGLQRSSFSSVMWIFFPQISIFGVPENPICVTELDRILFKNFNEIKKKVNYEML